MIPPIPDEIAAARKSAGPGQVLTHAPQQIRYASCFGADPRAGKVSVLFRVCLIGAMADRHFLRTLSRIYPN